MEPQVPLEMDRKKKPLLTIAEAEERLRGVEGKPFGVPLTIEEAEALLRVPRSWLYERTRKGEIPHLKLGKYLRFDREELLAWVQARRVGNGSTPLASARKP